MDSEFDIFSRDVDWKVRLDKIVETMREISTETRPEELVKAYSWRMREMSNTTGFLSISRRGLEPPKYRIARSHIFAKQKNPWKQRDQLPVFEGGFLGKLVFSNEAHIIDDLDVPIDDPAYEHLKGQRSLVAIPVFDGGVALNVVIQMRDRPRAFDPVFFPQMVWTTNLFARATHNLVMRHELAEMHERLDQEVAVVGEIQRSLLPTTLPEISNMDLSAHYETSQRAGGDYYDVLRLPGGRWGILIADVSGHGTPAAVLMAITHAITHLYPGPPTKPCSLLEFLSQRLNASYTNDGTFVTAFYGIYDPETRELSYALAGHPPPRLKHCDDGTMDSLDAALRPPLGIMPVQDYADATVSLRTGDQIIFYTDGITEARNPAGDFFGVERLDDALESCHLDSDGLIQAVLRNLEQFTEGAAPDDDRTLLVAKIK
ncbi:MAG: PP2C family protein-serine/threonine phosphatase [Planctomycetota bacterium]|nr:PP2C family protein-serine/threonine phosphatase [Planctomycetota bacterium]